VSLYLLKLYIAWTSHLLADVSRPLATEVTRLLVSQVNYYPWANLGYLAGKPLVLTDLEALAVLGVFMASAFQLSLGQGKNRALLLSVQAAALTLMALGAEIAIFDYNEFYLHVTQAQTLLDFAPWFSNADLLLCAVAIFATSSCLLHFRRLQLQGVATDASA
jgi:hypothetical protein